MVAETWYWIIGVPIIVALLVRAWRKSKEVTRRIAEVRDDLARSPLPPAAMLAQLYQEPQETDGKRPH